MHFGAKLEEKLIIDEARGDEFFSPLQVFIDVLDRRYFNLAFLGILPQSNTNKAGIILCSSALIEIQLRIVVSAQTIIYRIQMW
jgi:hypothetical protein